MANTKEIIAIVEICFYVPLFLLTLVVAFRHGFARQLGWVFLCIFTVVRIVGSAFEYESIKNPTSTTDVEWSAILQTVGLSPLFLASMGLIKRMQVSHIPFHKLMHEDLLVARCDQVTVHEVSQRSRVIQIARIPTILALILSIVGGTDQFSNDASKASSGKTFTKVGIIIFIAIYVLIFGLVLVTGKDVRNAPRGDRPIYWAMLISLPLLAVRLLWSILAAFTTNPSFQIGGSQPLVQLFMATVEEFIVVLLYTLAGVLAPGRAKMAEMMGK